MLREVRKEIGIRRMILFAWGQVQAALLSSRLILSPLRILLLRLFGAHIGANTIMHCCSFFNTYRTGFSGIRIGHHCFIGDECLLDLAECITLGDHVTLAERVTILTHTNVGYHDHPLQSVLPSSSRAVHIGSNSFIGANVTIMEGVTIGEGSVVGTCSLVREDVPPHTMVVGVPARVIRTLS